MVVLYASYAFYGYKTDAEKKFGYNLVRLNLIKKANKK